MESTATAPLRDLLNSLNSLTTLLSTSNSTASYSSLPTLVSSLIKADDELTTRTLPALRQHQTNYAQILDLRTRAAYLNDEITSLIRSAAQLRGDIAEAHHIRDQFNNGHDSRDSHDRLDGQSSVAHDDDQNQDQTDEKEREVDYTALTSLAARIARFTDISSSSASPSSSSSSASASHSPADGQQDQNQDKPETKKEEDDADDDISKQKAALEELALAQHRQGHAGGVQGFAESWMLRNGALGRLQVIREAGIDGSGNHSEDAVDAEVARLVRATEGVEDEEEKAEKRGSVQLRQQQHQQQPAPPPQHQLAGSAKKSDDGYSTNIKTSTSSNKETVPEQPKKKTLSLDFEDLSDDDDDDDD